GGLTVTARDPYGNTATGYAGTVHLGSSDGQASLPGDYTFTASDAGSHTFSATLLTAGTQALTATDAASSSLTGAQAAITVSPAAASPLVVQGSASAAAAGPRGGVTVRAEAPYGNTATGYAGTVPLGSSDGQAGLPGDYPFPASDAGRHTFSVTL